MTMESIGQTASAVAISPRVPPLYTPEQRARRDATRWTLVQGVLAPWEDVFSFAVIALHLLYVFALIRGQFTPDTLMWIALAAYAAYLVNAGQFVWKLRQARLSAEVAS